MFRLLGVDKNMGFCIFSVVFCHPGEYPSLRFPDVVRLAFLICAIDVVGDVVLMDYFRLVLYGES